MKPVLVLHHSADFDGLFCREIARKAYGEQQTEFLGWDYGQPVPEVPPDTLLVMLDLAVPGLMGHPKLLWIDHHKSSIAQYSGLADKPIPGWRIDGVAACRLAWQWWFGAHEPDKLPDLEDFRERRLQEPLAVRLAGEYDVWDKRDSQAELFQHGLRSQPLTAPLWSTLLSLNPRGSDLVARLLGQGEFIQYAQQQSDASLIKAKGFRIQWEGLSWLCCNHARFNSLLFAAETQPTDDGLLGFNWNGRHWSVSLYGSPFNHDLDLSKIAIKYGGGGHARACGFTCTQLPFPLSPNKS